MGMPPVSLADLLGETAVVVERRPVGEARGGDGRLTGLEPANRRDLRRHLVAGKMPTRPGLRALPALEVECLHRRNGVPGEAESSGCKLVEISRARFLLGREHAAFAGADRGACGLRARGQRHLRFAAERSEAHVRHEERNGETQRAPSLRADDELRFNGFVVQQGESGELRRDDLDVVPRGKFAPRDPHGARRPVGSRLRQTVARQGLDRAHVWLVRRSVRVREGALVGLAVEGLGVLAPPSGDLVFVDVDRSVFHPGLEASQALVVGVRGHPGADAEVPPVETTDQVFALHLAVGEQSAAVEAPAVEHGHAVRLRFAQAHDDEIHTGDERMARFEQRELVPPCYCVLLHHRAPSPGMFIGREAAP